MKEILNPKGERYWLKAFPHINRLIRTHRNDESRLVGRAFECLGYAMISDLYPYPRFILTSPRQTFSIKTFMSEDELKFWQPRFPDGIILHNSGSGIKLRIIGMVEYKTGGINNNIEDVRDQLEGCVNLLEFLKLDGGNRGKPIFRELFGLPTENIEIPKGRISFLFVTPKNKVSFDFDNPYVLSRFALKMVSFPLTSSAITARVRDAITFSTPHYHL